MARNHAIPQDQLDELIETFETIDTDGNGSIDVDELQDALKICGFNMARYQVRNLIEQYDVEQVDGQISLSEFKALYRHLKSRDFGANLQSMVRTRENLLTHNSAAASAADDVKHSVRLEEQVAFSDWINKNLMSDPHCKKYLPLNTENDDLYSKCKDGILLCKVINKSAPETIDERAINMGDKLSVFKMGENLSLALNSARSIGCAVVNIGPGDIEKGIKHLILGLLWQIIKVGLLADVNIAANADLAVLLLDGETIEDLLRLSPEQILIRWVNYHLANAGCSRRISNFGEDIRDSEAYAYLLQQIAPKDDDSHIGYHPVSAILSSSDHLERATQVLDNADKLDAKMFVRPNDIVSGNHNLNLAFVANLFNHYPALEATDMPEVEIIEETREERTYRNWMNSMLKKPYYVNYLYHDLRDGLIIFELFEFVSPGIVVWKRVNKQFPKLRANFLKLENCNYAVELGHSCKFSLVGVGGADLQAGNVTLTLALVWQLMRAYTLAVLSKLANQGKPVEEKSIVEWANGKLKAARKTTAITSFQDRSIETALPILDLIDALRPGIVNYKLVYEGVTEQERVDNAKLALALARKAGAAVYALHDDIVEVKPKMVMTIFACLMMLDHSTSARTNGAGDQPN